MKSFAALLVFTALLSISGLAYCDSFDAVGNYSCESANSVWRYEAYRQSDSTYLLMVYGHPQVKEFSRYGTDGFYLPDGKQEFYPFLTSFDGHIVCSPATVGDKYDAVLGWEAPSDCTATITGNVRILGNSKGTAAEGKKVSAKLVLNGKTIWSAELSGPVQQDFSVTTPMKYKDVARLHIINSGDASGNLTGVNMHVESKK